MVFRGVNCSVLYGILLLLAVSKRWSYQSELSVQCMQCAFCFHVPPFLCPFLPLSHAANPKSTIAARPSGSPRAASIFTQQEKKYIELNLRRTFITNEKRHFVASTPAATLLCYHYFLNSTILLPTSNAPSITAPL